MHTVSDETTGWLWGSHPLIPPYRWLMKFRMYYRILGGHTHVRVFAGKGETLGKCGDLVFRNEEWDAFVMRMTGVEFIQEAGAA